MAANNIPLFETLTGVPANSLSHMELMIGRPHNYLQNTDPGARTYIRHMLQDAPLIMIRPGRVNFTDDTSKLVKQVQGALGLSEPEAQAFVDGASPVYNKETGYGVTEADKKSIEDAIARKERGTVHNYETADASAALRYFEFQPALSEYISVLATLSSRLYSRLKGASVAMVNSMTPDLAYGGAYTFWADNASSVSESASAEVGETALAGIVKQVSNLSRQAGFFLGENFRDETEKNTIVTNAMQSISEALGSERNVSGVSASLGSAVLGMNPMFPEIWKDSSFGRSYNLSFKFHSPYGDAASVYQNVLLPFTMLLGLVLPVLRTPATYSEPFVFQLDCPGRFACDLGICTDFSFVKGGSEGLWTDQGLPRAIDVTMTVKDLYPTLAASQNNQSMYMNIGMGTFLDNLAGINLLQRNAGKGDVLQRMHAGINAALQQGASIPDIVESRIQIFGEQSGIAAGMRGVGALFGSGN